MKICSSKKKIKVRIFLLQQNQFTQNYLFLRISAKDGIEYLRSNFSIHSVGCCFNTIMTFSVLMVQQKAHFKSQNQQKKFKKMFFLTDQ